MASIQRRGRIIFQAQLNSGCEPVSGQFLNDTQAKIHTRSDSATGYIASVPNNTLMDGLGPKAFQIRVITPMRGGLDAV